MRKSPYGRFRASDLTLNDYLALDRTILANERSLLAYARTSLALIAVGGSCIKFFGSWWMTLLGYLFLVASGVVAVVGWRSFKLTQAYLTAVLEETTGKGEHPLKDTVEPKPLEESESGKTPSVPT